MATFKMSEPFLSGHYYITGIIANCKDVWAQQEKERTDGSYNKNFFIPLLGEHLSVAYLTCV